MSLQHFAIVATECSKFRDGHVSFRNHAVAPTFRLPEDLVIQLWLATERIDCTPDRLSIDVAHDLADELFLSPHCAVRIHFASLAHSIDKFLIVDNFDQLTVRQLDKSFAQLLQVGELPLARALAGL